MDMRKILNRLDESSRIGTAVRLDEIPKAYKGLKVIGRGATSVVLEKDPQTVLVFTRDHMKVEYLVHHEIAEFVDQYDSYGSHIEGMNQLPITILKMPKLDKINGPNLKKVRDLIKDYHSALSKHTRFGGRRFDHEETMRNVLMHFSAQEQHILSPVCNFLLNYDASQFGMDLGPRNFMQTADGQIVVLDPIVAQDLLDLIVADKKRRYRDREERAAAKARYGGHAWA